MCKPGGQQVPGIDNPFQSSNSSSANTTPFGNNALTDLSKVVTQPLTDTLNQAGTAVGSALGTTGGGASGSVFGGGQVLPGAQAGYLGVNGAPAGSSPVLPGLGVSPQGGGSGGGAAASAAPAGTTAATGLPGATTTSAVIAPSNTVATSVIDSSNLAANTANAAALTAGTQLNELQANPSLITSMPDYQAGLQAVERTFASQGYQGSGNMLSALSQFGGGFYNQQVQQLQSTMGLAATAGVAPATLANTNIAATNAATNAAAQGTNQQLTTAEISAINANIANLPAQNMIGGAGGLASLIKMLTTSSDRRLKTMIRKIGKTVRGLSYFEFAYKDDPKKILYTGVMSDEVRSVMPQAVIRGEDGFDRVFYDMLGVPFLRVDGLPVGGV